MKEEKGNKYANQDSLINKNTDFHLKFCQALNFFRNESEQ